MLCLLSVESILRCMYICTYVMRARVCDVRSVSYARLYVMFCTKVFMVSMVCTYVRNVRNVCRLRMLGMLCTLCL